MKADYKFNEESYERNEFSQWQAKMHSNRNELLFEKRKAELNRLVKKVINDELDETDRKIVELHWYKGLSKAEVAEKLGIDRSTVHRHFTAINETVYEKLKYAVEVIYAGERKEDISFFKKSDNKHGSLIDTHKIALRLKAMREEHYTTVEALSEKTGISPDRILASEKRGGILTVAELKKLTSFYKVSCNYIIFGTD